METVEFYRAKVIEMKAFAASAQPAEAQAGWPKMAASWDRLILRVEAEDRVIRRYACDD